MSNQPRQVGGGRRAIGDIAPKLAALTDDVLFDDVWNRPGLAARDRRLVTVAALIAGGHAAQRIVGATKEHHLSDAAAAVHIELTDDEVHALERHDALRRPSYYR
ncbi:carboxymuconolactone decarboxylase family protein [Curtobacterium sp. MCBD17_023]|uniref:carboxymuconolactone decarboxylase family protein n=1 Tax=Curtobacterium sp. MCBD17_023 TaxID=2175657 RepID=UPI000D9AEDF8|nr:carboxymuconolactone decarboxylase family protein [Curtobacterium sp. MCBD17_023]PYY50932.1 hypothetical protein DEI84_03920 [Curtobacterium sp. MCBD17_023]